MTLQHSFPLLWRTLKLYIDIKDLWVEPGNEQKQNFIVLCLEDFRVNILLQCNLACWLIKICCCCCWKKKQKWTENLKHFSKEYIQMVANRHEKMLNVCNQRNANPNMTRYYLTHVRMAILKKTTNKCGQVYGGKGTLVHYFGNVNWCSYCGKQYIDSSKN